MDLLDDQGRDGSLAVVTFTGIAAGAFAVGLIGAAAP